jgi:hypothetical protein
MSTHHTRRRIPVREKGARSDLAARGRCGEGRWLDATGAMSIQQRAAQYHRDRR